MRSVSAGQNMRNSECHPLANFRGFHPLNSSPFTTFSINFRVCHQISTAIACLIFETVNEALTAPALSTQPTVGPGARSDQVSAISLPPVRHSENRSLRTWIIGTFFRDSQPTLGKLYDEAQVRLHQLTMLRCPTLHTFQQTT